MRAELVSCAAIVEGGKRRGERCGRRVTAFIAHGQGRCGKHMSARQRVIALAVREAVADMHELRAVREEPREREHEQEPQRDDTADDAPGFEWPGAGWTDITDEDVSR